MKRILYKQDVHILTKTFGIVLGHVWGLEMEYNQTVTVNVELWWRCMNCGHAAIDPEREWASLCSKWCIDNYDEDTDKGAHNFYEIIQNNG